MDYEKAWLFDHVSGDLKEKYCVKKCFQYIYFNSNEQVIQTAVKELSRAISIICQGATTETTPKKNCTVENISWEATDEIQDQPGIYLLLDRKQIGKKVQQEGYKIETTIMKDTLEEKIVITSCGVNGILYGVFALIRKLQCGVSITDMDEYKIPSNPLRMLNHWDNMDGSIERGYSGKSFFFAQNDIIINERTKEYARLVASVGINAVVINNVNVLNAATYLITERYFSKVKELQDILGEYGIKLFLSINYAASIELGGLDSADPCDSRVSEWWTKKVVEVYSQLPGLGGFLVKADSEGRPGPFTYNRTQAEGANMLARALKPYDGVLIWRCFVYNCNQDWRDYVTDRAKAGYDYFHKLDGQFEDNVILQIKNGPMDFQVREPVSPLFGGMKSTNQMLEVQIAQEYTGQQIDICYLIPWFKEILAFKTYVTQENDTVKDIVSGKTFGNQLCGMAAVCNTGNDANWTGHDLAAANLYGFGRLSYDTSLTAEEIAKEWIRMTFSSNQKVVDTIESILMQSWPAYENYNAPLGIGWMVNPGYHYGPSVDGYEYSRWGTYHHADLNGIGVDRTMNGTGYTRQYHSPNFEKYESLEYCPDELILFFHHLPYTYRLHSNKTVIQHIYDTHFEGVESVKKFITMWNELEGLINPIVHERVSKRLELQLKNAKEWRDQVNTYFYRKSGIPDEGGRKIY